MAYAKIKVLLIEDDEEDFLLTQDVIEEIPGNKYELEWVSNFEEGKKAVLSNKFDIYLVDYRLGKEDGLKLLEIANENEIEQPMIILTGHNDHVIDMQALEMGATDFLVKANINPNLVDRTIRYSIQIKKSVTRLSKSEELLSDAQALAHIGHFNLDVKTNKLEWSDEHYRIFGLEPQSEPMIYERFIEFVVTEDIQKMKTFSEDLMTKGEFSAVDYRIKLPDHTIKHLHVKAKVDKNTDGQVFRISGITQDVSSRVEKEQELIIKSEAISSASIPMCFADLNGTITYANPAFVKMWGFEKESDVIGISNNDLGNSSEKVEEIMTALHTTGSWSGQDRAQRKDGTTFDVFLTSSLVKNSEGVPISTIATFMDITELKKTQLVLQEKSQTLRSSMKLAQIGAWQYDLLSNNIMLDEQTRQIFDISPNKEFLTFDEFIALFQAKDQQDIIEKFQKAIVTKSSCKKDCSIKITENKFRWVASEGQVLLDKNGEVFKLMGVSLDITEQIQKEEELKEYSEKLEQKVIARTSELAESQGKLMEAQKIAKVAYIEYDFINKTYQGSKQLFKIFNLDSTSSISTEQFNQLIHPEDLAHVQSIFDQARQNNKFISVDFRIITKDGQIKYIHLQTSKILKDEAGKTTIRRGTIQDTTSLKKAEHALAETLKKEQELNQLKSRFVSMASHEFRTPLSSILSSTGLIKSYGERENFEKQKKHIERIKSSVRNLTSILNDFLSLEKLESGKVNYTPETVDLHEFVGELKEEIGLIAKESQVIHHQHSGEEKAQLDQHLVKNILINLMSNAIKYSPNGEDVYLITENNPKLITIKVRDQGIGIPEEDHELMFSRFFRASNAGTIQGTGLGLTIVKRYLDLMGGTISFTSQPNKGTTFEVKIPKH